MAYVYKITNNINDKIYVGQTHFSLDKRFKEHCYDKNKEKYKDRPIYQAMNEYGIEHFKIELIEETDNPTEREMYWIKQLHTQIPLGYNTTRGGVGKKYIDDDLVVAKYSECQSIQDTADSLGICVDSASQILNQYSVNIRTSKEILTEKYGKPVDMFDLQDVYLRSFSSLGEAARYMVDNNLTNCKQTTIKQHITEACSNRRKTAAKFKWKYSNTYSHI